MFSGKALQRLLDDLERLHQDELVHPLRRPSRLAEVPRASKASADTTPQRLPVPRSHERAEHDPSNY